MRAVLIAIWRLFYGLLFYPLMVGLFLWIYITGRHWIYGAIIIAAILILDPIWRVIARRCVQFWKSR
jgi:hypothetical protein